jgi:hypothetical protein
MAVCSARIFGEIMSVLCNERKGMGDRISESFSVSDGVDRDG